jgi:holliday junction DNA helicase RuvB
MHLCPTCSAELNDNQIFCTTCGVQPVAKPVVKSDTPQPPQAEVVLDDKGFWPIVGQQNIINRLQATCEFCRNRARVAEHILLIGPDGMGKRTIAYAFGHKLGGALDLEASKLEYLNEFSAAVTSLESRQVLVVQDIGSLRPNFRQPFLTALRDFRFDIPIGKGPGARLHPFPLNHFTCIATASRESDCPPELREAFAMAVSIEPYSPSEP